jgi:hypothetical protein
MDVILRRLPRSATRPVSASLQQLGEELLRQARRLEADAKERAAIREHRRLAGQLYQLVEMHRLAGAGVEDAIAAAAAAAGREPDQVREIWRAAGRRNGAARRVARNRRVLILAAQGWRDLDIGRKVKLHPKSVGRIIRVATRRGEFSI